MIPYTLLRPCDIIGVTDTFTPFSIVERIKINGWKYAFASNKSTHITIACDRGAGLLYGCAMDFPKIDMEELHQYDHDKNGNHIVFVGRHPAFDNADLRMLGNQFLIDAHAAGIKYDIGELFDFFGYCGWDSTKEWICSDLPKELFKKCKAPFPSIWDERGHPPSPWDWQIFPDLTHIYGA